jgi:hypothetical protein
MVEQDRKPASVPSHSNIARSELEKKAEEKYNKMKYTMYHKVGAGIGITNIIKVDKVIAADFNHKVTNVFGEENCYLANVGVGQKMFIERCLDLSPLRDSEAKVNHEKYCKEEESLRVLYCPVHGNLFPTKERDMVEKESALKTFLLEGCMKLKEKIVGPQHQSEEASAKKPTTVSYLYRTLMYEETMTQDPYTLFNISDIVRAEDTGGGRFVAYMPLCGSGLFLQIWPAGKGEGRLVYVPFGKCLFLRGNMVHGGGFCSDSNFNRNGSGHFFLFLNTRHPQHKSMAQYTVSTEYRHADSVREIAWPGTKH